MKPEDLPCKGKFCGRPGLPILPLRVAYVPDGTKDLPLEVAMAPEFFYTDMKGGRYQLRVISEGFVWTYDKRRAYGWRAFAATPSGRFREILLHDGEYPNDIPKFSCMRDGHNLEASLINVERPDLATGPVWVGYSRAWWTKDTRERLAGDEVLRAKLMAEIDPKAIHGGAPPPPAAGFRVDPAGEKIVEHVLEYRDYQVAATKFAVTTVEAVDRTCEAGVLAERTYDLATSGGIALALHDPVGVTQDINTWRNQCVGKLAQFKLEQKNLREYVVSDLVMGLKYQLQDAGESSDWPRYAQHVDMGRVEKIYAEHQRTVDALEPPILDAAADWTYWLDQSSFWLALDTYDVEDRVVAQKLEDDFADCIDGAGAIESEQEVLDSILEAPADGDHKALWLALAGGDDDLVQFLAGKLAGGKGLSLGKKLRSLSKEFNKWMGERRVSARTAARASSVAISRTLGAQLSRLAVIRPDQASKLRAWVSLTAAARMDIEIRHFTYTVSSQLLIKELYEAGWEPSSRGVGSTLQVGSRLGVDKAMHGAWLATQVETKTQLTLELWLPESVAARATAVTGSTAARSVTSMAQQATVPMLALPMPTPTPYQGLIKWLRTLDGPIAGLGAVLSIGALTQALQDYAQAGAAGDAAKQKKAAFGIASGISGVSFVIVEVWSGTVKARMSRALTADASASLFVRSGVLGLAGGAFALGSAVSEGVYLVSKGQQLIRGGDTQAGALYRRSGVFFIAAGVASAATAVIQAGAALSAAGITAASGGIFGSVVSAGSALMFIPVWGWIVLGIAALAAGLYFLFRGQDEEDTAIEVWLSRSVVRNESMYAGSDRAPFKSLEEELSGFNQAVFKLEVLFTWLDEVGRDRLILKVLLPGYDESRSRFAYQLSVAGPRRNLVVARRGIALSSDPDLQPRSPGQTSLSAAPEQSWLEQQMSEVDEYVGGQASRSGWMDAWQWVRKPRNEVDFAGSSLEPAVAFEQYEGYAMLSTELLLDEDDLLSDGYDSSVLKFEYWPDALTMPELVIGAGGDGINYQLGMD